MAVIRQVLAVMPFEGAVTCSHIVCPAGREVSCLQTAALARNSHGRQLDSNAHHALISKALTTYCFVLKALLSTPVLLSSPNQVYKLHFI